MGEIRGGATSARREAPRRKKITSGHTYPEPHFRAVRRIRMISHQTGFYLRSGIPSVCFHFGHFGCQCFCTWRNDPWNCPCERQSKFTLWKLFAHQSTISVGFATWVYWHMNVASWIYLREKVPEKKKRRLTLAKETTTANLETLYKTVYDCQIGWMRDKQLNDEGTWQI